MVKYYSLVIMIEPVHDNASWTCRLKLS